MEPGHSLGTASALAERPCRLALPVPPSTESHRLVVPPPSLALPRSQIQHTLLQQDEPDAIFSVPVNGLRPPLCISSQATALLQAWRLKSRPPPFSIGSQLGSLPLSNYFTSIPHLLQLNRGRARPLPSLSAPPGPPSAWPVPPFSPLRFHLTLSISQPPFKIQIDLSG